MSECPCGIERDACDYHRYGVIKTNESTGTLVLDRDVVDVSGAKPGPVVEFNAENLKLLEPAAKPSEITIDAASDEGSIHLTFYVDLRLVIDGRLQEHLSFADMHRGRDKDRLYARWSVPHGGPEFTGQVGREYVVDVVATVDLLDKDAETATRIYRRTMTCVSWGIRGGADLPTVARAIFEVPTLVTK